MDQGGLNMPNIQYQDKSLMIAWVNKFPFEKEWAQWSK